MSIKNLTLEQTQDLAQFLMTRMSMHTRKQFMAQMPLTYAMVNPGVDKETIAFAVVESIANARGEKI